MTAVSHDLPMISQTPVHQVGQQLTNAVGNFTATFVAQNEAERLQRSTSIQEKVMTVTERIEKARAIFATMSVPFCKFRKQEVSTVHLMQCRSEVLTNKACATRRVVYYERRVELEQATRS
jgi:hypothetical protein